MQSMAGSGGMAEVPLGPTAGIAATAGSGGFGGTSVSVGSAGQAGMSHPTGRSIPARPSNGCGREVVSPETSIQVGALRASYRLDLPQAYDSARAYPVVLAFREENTSLDAFRAELSLPAATASEAIVVYPDCLNQAASWDVQRDIGLYEALLPKLAADYCIDLDRVFAVGYGSGALFVNALGCIHPDEVRAIAPLSGAPRPAGACAGQTAVWMLQDKNDLVLLDASRGNRDFWARQNACDVTMSVPVDPAPCVEYLGCDTRMPVRYCEYDGAAALPSFAGSAVWDFFSPL